MPEHQDTTVDGQLDMIHAFVSLGVAVVSVLVFFQCWKLYMKRQTREHNKTYTACSSPDCVRCTKYNTIRLDAAKKAKECYTEETPHSDRLCSAMEGNAKFQHTSQAPNVFYVPNLQASPWWDISSFKLDVKLLENNCRQICDEMCELYYDDAQCHNGWTSNITAEGSWNTYYFYNQGQEIISNCDRCPKTYQVIKQLTCFMDGCVFGNALFSVLDPGSFITEHCGPTNIRIRCHLGLNIPLNCAISVNRETRGWHEGKCTIFDDSFIHSAKHSGTSFETPRAVFILDFWHPDLTQTEKTAISYAFGSDISNTD